MTDFQAITRVTGVALRFGSRPNATDAQAHAMSQLVDLLYKLAGWLNEPVNQADDTDKPA
jgi:hypothetical protein